ncbi:hypothetical protein Pint_16721 [Pistacia integerrima]|uniref:Uncharacterized protein n=1 Tax=Pistacia integerrima TaxID=434235 RepID=A0ACC0ZAV4_9ROSI|nr:hypothetical protein Pint_16721 [Pistacia integerrima]
MSYKTSREQIARFHNEEVLEIAAPSCTADEVSCTSLSHLHLGKTILIIANWVCSIAIYVSTEIHLNKGIARLVIKHCSNKSYDSTFKPL